MYYVGLTTRGFGTRMLEHAKGYLSGEYGINDPEEMKKGKRVLLWEGLWRGADIEEFIKRHTELSPTLVNLLSLHKIYIAPLDCEIRVIERIESAIATYLHEQEGAIGAFQEEGIRYKKRKKNEEPLFVKIKYSSKIVGLPKTLKV